VPALIDSHLHLARPEFDVDRERILGRARAAGVGAWLHVGYDPESIERALALSETDPVGWATAGIHPHDAASYDDRLDTLLRHHAADGRIVAIGECGLDFFRDLSPRDAQAEAFRRQIAIAIECDLPMVFHVRDAYAEARALLESVGLPPRRGVFHAFAGDAAFARWAVDAGFRLGIGGPLTYRNSRLPEAIAGLPATSFLLETDAPWLPPHPWRGQRNEPAYLRLTAESLAASLDLSIDALAATTAEVFADTFRIELPESVMALQPSSTAIPTRS